MSSATTVYYYTAPESIISHREIAFLVRMVETVKSCLSVSLSVCPCMFVYVLIRLAEIIIVARRDW